MKITIDNFASAKYDVFSMFNSQWALCTAGTPAEYNTMTIGWGTMGTIWGPPNRGKQIITVFLRESRRTSDILLEGERFTVCFFPEEKRQDLIYLGMHKLNELLHIDRLMICGGGIVDYTFLQAGLIDELSLVIVPLTDGGVNVATVFVQSPFVSVGAPIAFKLLEAKTLPGDGVWLRYQPKNII